MTERLLIQCGLAHVNHSNTELLVIHYTKYVC